MFRVIEVASMLGVSKVTIYKKMSALKGEIKPYVIKEKNITFLTHEAVELIKASLKLQPSLGDVDQEMVLRLQIEKERDASKNELIALKKASQMTAQNHMSDLVQTYEYFKVIHNGKNERLKVLTEVVESLKSVSTEIKKQIELFEELSEQARG